LFYGRPDSDIERVPFLVLAKEQPDPEEEQLTEEIRGVELRKERKTSDYGSACNATHGKERN
jgi:hypothetical protein